MSKNQNNKKKNTNAKKDANTKINENAKINTNAKINIMDKLKSFVQIFKDNKQLDIILVFGVCALILILVGTLALKQPVVPVCAAIIIEAGIAMMLHNVELWIHGIAVVLQIVAGVLIHRVGLMILCVILYVLAILALQMWNKVAKRA